MAKEPPMRLTLHQLKVFAAVVKHKNMSRAAEELCMTQPAVSILMKQLENYYGMPLLEIIGKRIFLTSAGKELYRATEDIISRLAILDMTFSQMQHCLRGKLSVAAVTTAKYFMPSLLGKFKQQYPDIEIQLEITNRGSIIQRLQSNLDDLVIMSQPPENMQIIKHTFIKDELVIPAPSKHPLAKDKSIPLYGLESERFLLRELGSGTRMAMEKLFTQNKMSPKIIMELGSNEAIKQAVMAGMGLSLLSKLSLELELITKRLVILDIKGLPLLHRWYVIYLKDKLLSPIAKEFIKFILPQSENKNQEKMI